MPLTLQKKQNRRKSIQNSDPGKILDLVMSLTDDACADLEIKLNTYVRIPQNILLVSVTL